MSLVILLNEKLKFIALKTKRESTIQISSDESAQIILTVKLLSYFTDGTSLTVLKIAEKVGLFSYIHTLSQQEGLLRGDDWTETTRLLEASACMLSVKTAQALNLTAVPLDTSNSARNLSWMMSLCNAPLYNLNNPAYCKYVIGILTQSLCLQVSCSTQYFEWVTALLIYFCGLRRTIELSDRLKVCPRNIVLVNEMQEGAGREIEFKTRYELGFKCLTCSTNPGLQVRVCAPCAQHCHQGHTLEAIGSQSDFTCLCKDSGVPWCRATNS